MMEGYKSDTNRGGAMERREQAGGRAAIRWCGVGLRVLAMLLTFAAALVLGLDKQTTVVPVVLSPNLPAVNVAVTAKYHDMSAFLYFVVANAIACAYAAFSLILTVTTKKASLIIAIMDVMMVGLLFSSLGAGGAVGLLGFQGNSHVQWNKVCNVFDTFCHKVTAALLSSFIGSINYLLLAFLGALNLHKKLA